MLKKKYMLNQILFIYIFIFIENIFFKIKDRAPHGLLHGFLLLE